MAGSELQVPLKQIRQTQLKTYANDQKRISQDFKLEAADSADYSRRFVFELLQNADDEMPSSSVDDRCVRFELYENCLLVANTGRAFDPDDLEALTTLTQTTKGGGDDDDASIGHKGRGFTSVLDVTNNPAVFSQGNQEVLAAQFDREKTQTAIEQKLRQKGIDPEEYTDNVPLMPLPFPVEASDRVESLLNSKFTTVFRLPFSSDTDDRTYETIVSTFTKSIRRETVALLPNTDRVELVVGDRERTWTVDRTSWNGEVEATVVEIDCNGNLDEATQPTSTEKIVVFERERPIPGRQFVGIDSAILEDIGRLRTSVAFRLSEQDGKHTLQPLHVGENRSQRPFIHVFLPTEERSPIPALLNGTFQVNTSRRSLNMPTDPDSGDVVGLNAWLFKQVAETIAEDTLAFVVETDTTIAEFLRTIDFTSVLDNETARNDPVNQCFVSALREAFSGVPFVPRLEQLASGKQGFDPDPQPLEDVVVPYIHSDKERLGKLVAMIYGRDRVLLNESPEIDGYFPATSLLTPSVASVLASLGAPLLNSWEIPRVLGIASDENAVLQHRSDDDALTVDPIVYAIAETWQTLTNDEHKKRLATAAQSEAVFPVGNPRNGVAGPYYVHETTPDDIKSFFPPEQDVPTDALNGVRLFPRKLYYAGGSRQADAAAREAVLDGGEFESILQSIWNINKFGFQEIADKGIYPLLPGPSSGTPDDSSLRDTTVIKFIQRLACSSTSGQRVVSPDKPLTYQYRNTEQYYSLCHLPLPTVDGGWARAYEVYFGATWQREKTSEARIEQLLSDAKVDAPILACPERFGAKEEDDLSEWLDFFRWLGVAEHIRITPFFHPTQSHRYKSTEYAKSANRSVIDSESRFSPDALSDIDIQTYTDDLRRIAKDAAEEDEDERPFIWQVNGLEFDQQIVTAARDPEFGYTLLWHLHDWWDRLSVHADATVALYNNKNLRGRTPYLFTDDEKEGIKPNLWLWQLRRTPWLPTVLGTVPPKEAWLLPDSELQRYSLDIETERYPLLSTLLKESFREAFDQSPDFLHALSIRRHVNADSLTPTDVERFTSRIHEIVTDPSVGDSSPETHLSEIEAAYSYLGQELPPLDNQGNIQLEEWQPERTGIDSVPVPCFKQDDFIFRQASEVYFTRSHDEAKRFSKLDIPIFVLTRDDAPRIGAHLGMTDLVEAVEETPRIDEEQIEDTDRFRDEWLNVAAPYVLCRLKATRSKERTLRRDADSLSRFTSAIRLVSSLQVKYKLQSEKDVSPLIRPADYFIARDENGDRSFVYIVTESDDPITDPPAQTIAKAFAEYRGLSSWEPIYVLLQRAPDHRGMKDQLRAAGAPSSERELRARRNALEGDVNEGMRVHTVDGTSTIDRPVKPNLDPKTDEDQGSLENSHSETESSSATSSTRDGSRVPNPDQLTRIGESEVVADSDDSVRASTHERDQNSGSSNATGGGSNTSQSTTVTANYIDKVDEFGMEVTYQAEIERLRSEGCDNPEAYVHDIHTRKLYNEARKHEIAGSVLSKLEDHNVISEPYPGFDFIVISRNEEWPERCIELKSSGSNTRRPSISWNEWKSAKNEELRETYYLYVAAQLEAGRSGEAKLIQVPNPFSTLDSREQTKRSSSREVQVKLSEFHPEAGEVIERPIYWEE